MGGYLQHYPMRDVWDEHQAILDAVIAGDPDRAEAAARHHADHASMKFAGLVRATDGQRSSDRWNTGEHKEEKTMKLTDAQIATFEEEGYLFLPNVFSAEEMALLTGEIPGMFAQDRPEVIREKGSNAPRSAFYVQTWNPVYEMVARHPRLVEPGDAAARLRPALHASVQDQRQVGVRRRGVAVAPGLRHLVQRRRHADAARHEHRAVPGRGERVQRAADVHPAAAIASAGWRRGTT